MNLQTGAFGDPSSLQTLILFWTKMEMLHYPGSGETKAYLEEQLQQQMQAQQMAQQMAMQTQQTQAVQNTISQARQDAARDAGLTTA